ncbi:MAG: helix-turn-helix domain-containing protein [Nanoarchaeota archaeon]
MKQNIQEIEVWYVLPTIRKEIVKGLLEKGLNQNQIAKKLSLRKSTISQYVNKKRGKDIKFDDETIKSIKKAVDNIMDNKEPSKEIANICELFVKNRTICEIHRTYENVPIDCGLCLK